jgi:hypothetical protein
MPMQAFAPAGAFCFTVLREPGARLVSHVADWRRIGPHDYASSSPPFAAMFRDAGRMRLAAFLGAHGHAFGIDNHLTRALAAATVGVGAYGVRDAKDLFDEARTALARFQFVGVTEKMEATLNALAAELGFYPPRRPPRLNATQSESRLAEEVFEARELIASHTALDQRLYEIALRMFEDSSVKLRRTNTAAAFEARDASSALAGLEGVEADGDVVYSVREPLVGAGFHGRDGAGRDDCVVWSGPEPRFTLYMPAPSGVRLRVTLWIRGYAAESQRETLRVFVDGQPARPSFEMRRGYREALMVEARATRDFVALSIDVGETLTTGTEGTATFDARKKGLAFDRYGWRIIPEPADQPHDSSIARS